MAVSTDAWQASIIVCSYAIVVLLLGCGRCRCSCLRANMLLGDMMLMLLVMILRPFGGVVVELVLVGEDVGLLRSLQHDKLWVPSAV